MRAIFPSICAILLLAACEHPTHGPIAGGPCSYETSIVDATVAESDEDGAAFIGPDGEFYVPEAYLGKVPGAGETLTLNRELITEGTCTPAIYSVVKRGN